MYIYEVNDFGDERSVKDRGKGLKWMKPRWYDSTSLRENLKEQSVAEYKVKYKVNYF